MALQMELGRHEVLIERSVGGWNELTQKVLIGSREKCGDSALLLCDFGFQIFHLLLHLDLE